jgi:hypothetical protein
MPGGTVTIRPDGTQSNRQVADCEGMYSLNILGQNLPIESLMLYAFFALIIVIGLYGLVAPTVENNAGTIAKAVA